MRQLQSDRIFKLLDSAEAVETAVLMQSAPVLAGLNELAAPYVDGWEPDQARPNFHAQFRVLREILGGARQGLEEAEKRQVKLERGAINLRARRDELMAKLADDYSYVRRMVEELFRRQGAVEGADSCALAGVQGPTPRQPAKLLHQVRSALDHLRQPGLEFPPPRIEGARIEPAALARLLAPTAEELGRVLRALGELGGAAFGAGTGVVRMQATRDARGYPHLIGVPRSLGEDREAWSALVVRLPGPAAPAPAAGAKVSSRLAMALASDEAARAGADEALFLDAAGRLVEGARTNAIVVDAEGRLSTPPLALGAVAGVAREVLLERIPELSERVVLEPELRGAREIIVANAVRGARAVIRLDDFSVGDGAPGPWARLLDAALAED